MIKKRVIPVVLLKEGRIVQSHDFTRYRNLGNPIATVKRLADWDSDEVIYLNIDGSFYPSKTRLDISDYYFARQESLLESISLHATMPITFGGGLRTMEQVRTVISSGADKVSVNSSAIDNPRFLSEICKEFGSQCLVVSIDYIEDGETRAVWSQRRKSLIGLDLIEWALKVEDLGAGELFINSITRDGKGEGFDIRGIDELAKKVSIPLIVCGGAGQESHFAEAFDWGADAVAASNYFHFKDQSVFFLRKYLKERGYPVRSPSLQFE